MRQKKVETVIRIRILYRLLLQFLLPCKVRLFIVCSKAAMYVDCAFTNLNKKAILNITYKKVRECVFNNVRVTSS